MCLFSDTRSALSIFKNTVFGRGIIILPSIMIKEKNETDRGNYNYAILLIVDLFIGICREDLNYIELRLIDSRIIDPPLNRAKKLR